MFSFDPPGNGVAPIIPAIKRNPKGAKRKTPPAGTLAVSFVLCIISSASIILHLALPFSPPDHALQWIHSPHNNALRKLHSDPSHHFCAQQRTPAGPLVCAHGGDNHAAPPNSLDAFEAALDAGARCIEVDASLTKDNILVSLHNRDLAELLLLSKGNSGLIVATFRSILKKLFLPDRMRSLPKVGDYTWKQLNKLKWADGEHVATLRDVLNMAAARGATVTVDVKLREEGNSETEEAVSMAHHLLIDLKATSCGILCTVWAKSDAIAEALLALDPSQRVGIVAFNTTTGARAQGQDKVARHPQLDIRIVGAHYAMADPLILAETREAGRELHIWTADTPEIMAAALDCAPDAVVTSYPRALLAALEARAAACEDRRRRSE